MRYAGLIALNQTLYAAARHVTDAQIDPKVDALARAAAGRLEQMQQAEQQRQASDVGRPRGSLRTDYAQAVRAVHRPNAPGPLRRMATAETV